MQTQTATLPSLKGRVGRKISDFFMDFLGAEEGLKSTSSKPMLITSGK